MTVTLSLQCVSGSAQFTPRVFTLSHCGPVSVSRQGGTQVPTEDNAVFVCKVLSRKQAEFSFDSGQVYLRDTGSRNGTFVNNTRLSTSTQHSEYTPVYSGDVLRFGTQVRNADKTVKEQCIIARLTIQLPCGRELDQGSVENRPLNH